MSDVVWTPWGFYSHTWLYIMIQKIGHSGSRDQNRTAFEIMAPIAGSTFHIARCLFSLVIAINSRFVFVNLRMVL